MIIYAAPLQSYTTVFQRIAHHRTFGSIDKFFTPFFEENKKGSFTPKLIPEIDSDLNEGMKVIPQVLAQESTFLLKFAKECEQLGYQEINLNIGCPHIPVVRKGLGSGLLAHPEKLIQMLEDFYSSGTSLALSVKMRLSIDETMLWPDVIAILNQYPLTEVIVHPRTAKQMYKGEPDWDQFDALKQTVRHPLVGNGNINDVASFTPLKDRFSDVDRWMVGRGYLANPWLPQLMKGEKIEQAGDMRQLRSYFETFYGLVETHVTDLNIKRNLLHNFWFYLSENIEKGVKWRRSLDKKTSLNKYPDMVNELLQRQWINRYGIEPMDESIDNPFII